MQKNGVTKDKMKLYFYSDVIVDVWSQGIGVGGGGEGGGARVVYNRRNLWLIYTIDIVSVYK